MHNMLVWVIYTFDVMPIEQSDHIPEQQYNWYTNWWKVLMEGQLLFFSKFCTMR